MYWQTMNTVLHAPPEDKVWIDEGGYTPLPEEEPGRLTPQQYADIVAYMLWLSDAPQRENELPTDLQVLDRIFIQPSDLP